MKYFLLFLFFPLIAFSQTIQEKKESFRKPSGTMDTKMEEELNHINEMLNEKRFYLKTLHKKALELYTVGAEEGRYYRLLGEVKKTKKEISDIEEMWRDKNPISFNKESYSLWHQPETSLNQLVIDYGTHDFLYLIPPEIGNLRISINSNLPIPRESWKECLELILTQNGVGVRELSPYIRELFFLRNDFARLKHITSEVEDLSFYPEEERVCFVLSCDSPDPSGALRFIQKFSNPATTNVELIGHDIYIVGRNDLIVELVKLYDFFKQGKGGEEYQLVTLTKVDVNTMMSILESAFYGKERREIESLRIIPMQEGLLFLYGSKKEISLALNLIRDIEDQIENPKEKTLYWYTAKHSDAEELATLLAKIYDLLVLNGNASGGEKNLDQIVSRERETISANLTVAPPPITPAQGRSSHKTADGQNNFIVDQKTGSIIMVVEQEALSKIKELLKKLDVPKKMVQIEVLLFEKKISNQNKFGLNLLKIGSQASNTNATGFSWNNTGLGILEFLISHAKGSSGIPAFDLAYKFLLGQEDVQINACPSVLTVNQTPATIAIVEEISINTGAEKDKLNFARAQYGITLQITPTINVGDEEDDLGFVTLDTDITFDTTTSKANDRPDVTRRHIKNHVRIADGETVILGGLRRKISEDNKESIPFLGEIPGLGKLFSITDLTDSSTEMFLFITPKIIYDPLYDLEKIKKEELCKRPGDTPEFLYQLERAKKREKERLCEKSLTALFGRPSTSGVERREYDGK